MQLGKRLLAGKALEAGPGEFWADDDAIRRKILADNPARLYGY